MSAPECFPRAAASARFPLLRLFSGHPPPWPCSRRYSPSEVIQGLLTRLFKQSPLRRHATRWPPRAFGFWRFHIKVVKALLDNAGIFYARDDPHRLATGRARLDVDPEHPSKALRPSHRSMAFGRCPLLRNRYRGRLTSPASLGMTFPAIENRP